MKCKVIYSSKTGNTRKVAEAILEKMPAGTSIASVDESPDLSGSDLLVIGYWIDKGTADAKALKFIENVKSTKVVFFATLGAYPDSEHGKDCIKNGYKLFEDNGCVVVDSFLCQGAIDPKLMEWMKALPEDHPHAPDDARRKRWAEAAKHPDVDDLANAQRWVCGVLDKVKKPCSC